MKSRYCALIFIGLFATSNTVGLAKCGHGERPSYSDIDEVRYAATNCFGHCPNYQVLFTRRGGCGYVGISDVARRGTYEGTCSFEIFKRAVRALQARDFYSINYDSSALVLDTPHSIISVERCGVTTTLDWPDAPPEPRITLLMNDLDAITKGIKWRKTGSGTQPLF